MKLLCGLFLVVLTAAPTTFAHKSNQRAIVRPTSNSNTSAEEAWSGFWRAFRAAVQRRDRKALTSVIKSDGFQFGSDGLTPSEVFKWLDTVKRGNGNWADLDKALAAGAVPGKNPDPSYKSLPSRIAPPAARNGVYANWCAIFVFGKDSKWKWVAFTQLTH